MRSLVPRAERRTPSGPGNRPVCPQRTLQLQLGKEGTLRSCVRRPMVVVASL